MAEQISADLPEMPVTGRSRTGRAVALARLLHAECNNLLQLYKDRESFLSGHTPDGGRIVSPSPEGEAGEPSTEEQVQLLHSALRQCLGLLHCLIVREEEEMGEMEGEYESARKRVRTRLEHLLGSTRVLVETEDCGVEVGPDDKCNEELDGPVGSFAEKLWTYRVLLELIHWADHAAHTLHILHTEREGDEEI